jgi:hypothetical protein
MSQEKSKKLFLGQNEVATLGGGSSGVQRLFSMK